MTGQYDDVDRIVHVSSASWSSCPECNAFLQDFIEMVNHYLSQHHYVLLHVGTETKSNPDDPRVLQSRTAFVLGRLRQ